MSEIESSVKKIEEWFEGVNDNIESLFLNPEVLIADREKLIKLRDKFTEKHAYLERCAHKQYTDTEISTAFTNTCRELLEIISELELVLLRIRNRGRKKLSSTRRWWSWW